MPLNPTWLSFHKSENSYLYHCILQLFEVNCCMSILSSFVTIDNIQILMDIPNLLLIISFSVLYYLEFFQLLSLQLTDNSQVWYCSWCSNKKISPVAVEAFSMFGCLLCLNILFIYLFILRRGKGGRKRERNRCGENIHWLPLTCPQLVTWPPTQACALTRN